MQIWGKREKDDQIDVDLDLDDFDDSDDSISV